MQEISTKPYLLRALYEWCTDNGFTPHIAVKVDNRTRVPREFVRDGEIVLNISFDATSQLQMGNDYIEFLARFSGKSYKIEVPVSNVLAIYARENGQGMAFPIDGALPDEPVQEGAPEYEPLPADEFYDMSPEEKEQALREKAEREAAERGEAPPAGSSKGRKSGGAAADDAAGAVQAPSEGAAGASGEAGGDAKPSRGGDRKHLKVIK